MPKTIYYLFIILVVACSKADISTNPTVNLEELLGVSPTSSPLGGSELFFQNVHYGEDQRNQLDILLPKGTIEGVVLFFHGGGFTAGDKSDIFNDQLRAIVERILGERIALISANYTLLTTVGNQGVISALEDGLDVINFVQNHLSDLGIPSNKLVLAGASAGAGIAQWNGFREATNGQVQGIVALAAQSTYDLYEWENVFPGFYLDTLRQQNQFLNALFLQFYGGVPTQEDLAALDYRSFMDANDPALYVLNTAGDEVVNAQGALDFDVLYHSFRHADYLRAKAIEVELEFSGVYQESPDDFILRKLR